MEPAKIDWKRISSILVVDDLYENINAPKFVDLSAPDEPVDDEAWFCRPDCNHPTTVEDFLRATPLSKRSATASEVLPQRDRNTRDAYLKRRGLTQPSDLPNKDSNCDRFIEDGENQHPNLCATPSHHYNMMKAEIKSSTERKQIANPTKKEETPRLRSTLSARNLFGGRDLMNHITEFCNELKRLATRASERENGEKSDGKKLERKECDDGSNLGEMDEREERKPLLEVSKENCEAAQKNNLKEKQRMKKRVEVENNPSPLELKIGKRKEGENLLQIRTNPPSPQCFSASRGPDKAAPLKASRSKPQLQHTADDVAAQLSKYEVQLSNRGDMAKHLCGFQALMLIWPNSNRGLSFISRGNFSLHTPQQTKSLSLSLNGEEAEGPGGSMEVVQQPRSNPSQHHYFIDSTNDAFCGVPLQGAGMPGLYRRQRHVVPAPAR